MGHGTHARLVATLVLLLALAGAFHAAQLFRQDLLFTRVETELGFWGREDYHPRSATIERTEQQLNRLLGGTPANPQYLVLQANYAAWRGYWAEDAKSRQQFNRQAVLAQYDAVKSRPAHRHSWVKMLQYTSRIQDGKPMRTTAQARMRALQPAADPDQP